MKLLSVLLLGLVLLALSEVSAAAGAGGDRQSLEAIRAEVEAFLDGQRDRDAEEVRVQVGRLDARLRLPGCTEPLSPFLPQGRRTRGNVTVGVRCTGERPWTVYVPARVETYLSVAVIDASVARGETLAADDVRLEVREVGTLHDGYFTRLDDVVGKVARRTLTEGSTVRASMLTRPTLVRRGQRVSLVAGSGAVQVRTDGRALEDGVRGDVIDVRNVRSNRVVEGVVVSAGVVHVGS